MTRYYNSYQAYNKNIQMLYNNGTYHFKTDFGNGSIYPNYYHKNLFYSGQRIPVRKKPSYVALPLVNDKLFNI